jgi:hypothetical protein
MPVEYQILVECKARAPSGDVVNIPPGTYAVTGDQAGRLSVRLIQASRQIEITYGEFQRLKVTGAVKRL